MKTFNHNNDYLIQCLFNHYIINQSVFGALTGNKDYLDQAKNLMNYPMTFAEYCNNMYLSANNNLECGIKTFNEPLNVESAEILKSVCSVAGQEKLFLDQIKDISFIYTNVVNYYNSSKENIKTFFNANKYNSFVDEINTFGLNFYKDEGLTMNNEIYGGRFCEGCLNLLKKPMFEAEKYLVLNSNQSVFNDFYRCNLEQMEQ